ncbi:MAG: chemotaxis protein CheX [bacterium]|nr:chemotaxis protein CheX [bacterium]
MKVEYINPFIESASEVLEEIAQLHSDRGNLRLKQTNEPFRDVCAIIGVVGDIQGQVIYGFDQSTARNVVSRMMMGAEVTEFDEMARSALGELGNIVSGRASIKLEKLGKNIDLSPPTLVMATNVHISSLKIGMIVVPLGTDCGVIDLYVGLEESKK